MELFHAANQWANRPDDENFDTLEDMYAVTKQYADAARTKTVPFSDLRAEARGSELALVGRAGVPARFTNFAFRQLASRAGAPAGYLQGLPATLAAQNLNYGLKRHEGDAQLLFHRNGELLLLRAATSTRYERVWNYEVIGRLGAFSSRHGLVPAQQTFNWDGSSEIPEDAQKALYASDHDMFAFMMTPDRTIIDPTGQPLRRGVIVQNSEVGAASLKFMGFLFRDVCANHIIWGAQELAEVRLNHVGEIRERMQGAWVEVRRYMDGAASLTEADMVKMTVQIAGTKDEVLDKLFGIRSLRLSRKTLHAAYDAVVPEEDGDPNTVWGMAQGITRHSQTLPYTEDRVEMDRAAGRLMEITF